MPARILVVEDDAVLCDLLVGVLEEAGYAVSSAGDGVEALAAIARERPQLLVTDRMLPRLSGLDLIHRVRAEEGAGPQLPAVLITAAPPTDGLPPRTHLVPKPFNLAPLLALIAGLVANSD